MLARVGQWILVLVVAIAGVGCADDKQDNDKMTPTEYFGQTQELPMTPNGRVLSGTARDVRDN